MDRIVEKKFKNFVTSELLWRSEHKPKFNFFNVWDSNVLLLNMGVNSLSFLLHYKSYQWSNALNMMEHAVY